MWDLFSKISFGFQIGLTYLVLINIFTFFSFALDKSRAQKESRRTPEKTLWLLTLLGGSPAALLAMQYFHHKTKKISFQAIIIIILCFQIAVLFSLSEFILSQKDPIVNVDD